MKKFCCCWNSVIFIMMAFLMCIEFFPYHVLVIFFMESHFQKLSKVTWKSWALRLWHVVVSLRGLKKILLKRGRMKKLHGMLLFHCEAWKKVFLLKRGVMMKQLQSRFRLLSCIPVFSCNYFSNILFCNLAFSWYHFSNSASFLYSSLFM